MVRGKKPKPPVTPGERWAATQFAPTTPKYLDHVGVLKKREDATGVLWVKDAATSTWAPDTSDDATAGVLLATVRRAIGDPDATVDRGVNAWWVSSDKHGYSWERSESEAGALVHVLEQAQVENSVAPSVATAARL